MDAKQYWQVVEKHYPFFKACARKVAAYGGKWVDANDLLQEAITTCAVKVPELYRSTHYEDTGKLEEKYESIEGVTASQIEYTRMTVYYYLRKGLTKLRRQAAREEGQADPESFSSGFDSIADHDQSEIDKVVNREVGASLEELTDWEAWLVTHYYYKGHTIAELASITRYSETTIKADLSRARRRLSKYLKYAANTLEKRG